MNVSISDTSRQQQKNNSCTPSVPMFVMVALQYYIGLVCVGNYNFGFQMFSHILVPFQGLCQKLKCLKTQTLKPETLSLWVSEKLRP